MFQSSRSSLPTIIKHLLSHWKIDQYDEKELALQDKFPNMGRNSQNFCGRHGISSFEDLVFHLWEERIEHLW
jgi:hypothetical protein